MNKQQLRACFDSIRPSEKLVCDTLERIQTRRQGEQSPVRRMPAYAFATRLAAAACALVLLIGIGVTVGKDAVIAPEVVPAADERISPMVADALDGVGKPPAIEHEGELVGCEDMIAAAASYGGDYAVFSATVEAMYFVGEGEGIIALRPVTVAQKNVSGEHPGWVSDEVTTLAVHVDLSDAAWQEMLLNSVGGDALVGVHAEQREQEMVWVLHDLNARVEPVIN